VNFVRPDPNETKRTTMKKVILKPGKEKPLQHRHHWIFSGAISSFPQCEPGEIMEVYDSNNEQVGCAYFNKRTSIAGRMISFGKEDPYESIRASLERAISLRKHVIDTSHTTAYRLFNGEGDYIPGLVIDRYNDILVIQAYTAGIERLKPFLLEELQRLLPECTTIYEKSRLTCRKEEGLKEQEQVLVGEIPTYTNVKENGITFAITIPDSQKTGFFLDQREMRHLVKTLSKGKRVLNCFSYSGGFSLYALAGGASHVTSVDVSKKAIDLAKKNTELNGYEEADHTLICADVFDVLEEDSIDYDIVILDPPAFAKKKGDIKNATRGYRGINLRALKKMPPKSILITCSCSYYIDEAAFEKILKKAALEAGRTVKVLSAHRQALDHPTNPFHPETCYLKSLVLFVE
jgi:23S rRNA (cytosine1962-C5)-methyltransferase